MGGVRQQFGSAANIRLAQHSIRFYERFDTAMRTPDHQPRAWFRQRGYLFLANDDNADRFERRYERQRALGARVERLASTPSAPSCRIWPSTTSVSASSGRTTATPTRARCWPGSGTPRRRPGQPTSPARSRASGGRGRVRGVTLDDGALLDARAVVNAAGPFAARLAALADVALPVEPVRQHLFRCALPCRWPHRFPVVVDPGGVHWRHDDPVAPGDPDRIIVARTKLDEPPGENFDLR